MEFILMEKGQRVEDKDHGERVLKMNPLPETRLT